NQLDAESDCDSKDMEEEVKHMTDDEVMSKEGESNHGYTQNIQHFTEKDDVDEWLNAKITKHMTSLSDEVSSIANNEVDRANDNTPNTTPCRLPKELSPGSFLLPFNINSHNLYATTTLDAKDNTMPQRVYEYLGRSFLESTRAQIEVFSEEISFEIGSEKFKLNINSHQCIKKIYMVDIRQEEETFNLEIRIDLFSYESPTCVEFKQRTRSYGTPNQHNEIAEPISFSLDSRGLVKRLHVCKPIHVTYNDGSDEDCGMWPTCDPDSKFCLGYNEIFGVHYGQQKIDDTTRERRKVKLDTEDATGRGGYCGLHSSTGRLEGGRGDQISHKMGWAIEMCDGRDGRSAIDSTLCTELSARESHEAERAEGEWRMLMISYLG
ncbi:hypothetical protein Tco_0128161, partial [Tanacetum coccineum]